MRKTMFEAYWLAVLCKLVVFLFLQFTHMHGLVSLSGSMRTFNG